MRTGMEPGHGTGLMGTGAGHHSTHEGWTGSRETHDSWTGSRDTHGMGTGHTGAAGMGGVGTGYDAQGKETMGHKIKKMIPGEFFGKLCSNWCIPCRPTPCLGQSVSLGNKG
jgi:hypothetical protein